jgi:hypothetical protein
MELAIGVILMLLIAGVGSYLVLNDEEDTPNPKSKIDKYARDVQSKRSPPREVSDDEITPYQGFGGQKQQQKAQSRKRTQVRRRESSIWDNLAPKEHHATLNMILGTVFVIGLLVAISAAS